MSAIQITPNLTAEHDAVLTEYLRGESRLTRMQWQQLREAVDLLGQSEVTFQERSYTFRQFYETFIDRQFADAFLGTGGKPSAADILYLLVGGVRVGLCV